VHGTRSLTGPWERAAAVTVATPSHSHANMKPVRLPLSLRIVSSLSLALAGFAAHAESIYLSCTTTSFSGVDFAKVYKQVPKNPQDQFLQDALMEYDLVNLLKDRADSWEVNLEDKTVSSPERNSGPVFTDAKITSNKIEARVMAFGKSYVPGHQPNLGKDDLHGLPGERRDGFLEVKARRRLALHVAMGEGLQGNEAEDLNVQNATRSCP
jgi:hypothetical protein